MGMDVDYIAIEISVNKLIKIARDIPHGERGEIADEVTDFVRELELKYEKKRDKNRNTK